MIGSKQIVNFGLWVGVQAIAGACAAGPVGAAYGALVGAVMVSVYKIVLFINCKNPFIEAGLAFGILLALSSSPVGQFIIVTTLGRAPLFAALAMRISITALKLIGMKGTNAGLAVCENFTQIGNALEELAFYQTSFYENACVSPRLGTRLSRSNGYAGSARDYQPEF